MPQAKYDNLTACIWQK